MDTLPAAPQWSTIIASALDWEHAHANFKAAVANLPRDVRGRRPDGFSHSVWELAEHIRRTQHDLLDFCQNTHYKAPSWPDEYWPSDSEPSDAAWSDAIEAFDADNRALAAFATDARRDLTATIPHGAGQTYLQTILAAVDHTSYHVGQIIVVRRLLDSWEPS